MPKHLTALAFLLCLAVAWMLVHHYAGLDDDAHLYALQALARLHPELLSHDLFLTYGSQDKYTFFTALYAGLIQHLGLTDAGALLTALSHLTFILAGGLLVHQIAPREIALLSTGLLIVIPGYYGAQEVFQYAESFLSARNPAEAIVLFSIATFIGGYRWLGCVLIVGAGLIHPLMAAPGAMLLILLFISNRQLPWVIAAVGIMTAALVALAIITPVGPLRPVDPEWLEVIRARSGFLFLDTWTTQDWNWVLLISATLALAVGVDSTEGRIGRLALRTLLVGGFGLLLAALSSSGSPVELLLQGQPWRWLWLTTCLAVLLLAPTFITLWRDTGINHACATLLAASWILPAFPGSIFAVLALILWLGRSSVVGRYRRYTSIIAIAASTITVAWLFITLYTALNTQFTTGREAFLVEQLRNSLGIPGAAILIVAGSWWLIVHRRSVKFTAVLAALAVIGFIGLIPQTWAAWRKPAYSDSDYVRLAQWRRIIPPNSQVLWLEDPAAVWVLLERPSYMSISQSAGVVFSHATAREVARRTEVLRPWVNPGWLMTRTEKAEVKRPLSAVILRQICRDPVLDYVVGTEDLGTAMSTVEKWAYWNTLHLYSCTIVR